MRTLGNRALFDLITHPPSLIELPPAPSSRHLTTLTAQQSFVWGPRAPISGCSCVTWDGIDGELKVAWASGESLLSTLPSCVPIAQAEEEELAPAGLLCVPCVLFNDYKILLYSSDCRIFLIASEDRPGSCSAKVLLLTAIAASNIVISPLAKRTFSSQSSGPGPHQAWLCRVGIGCTGQLIGTPAMTRQHP